ncbi:MAG: MerR family transcriptional regulator [Oscillibacter sp.]|nr:MerR family transcriptional regulator [Oscillibacter sp.]MBR1690625.1 MerR family transcriptional regulator [Oscillibacter sp.]
MPDAMVAVLPATFDPAGIYTGRQVCDILQIGTSTLTRYVQKGAIRRGHRPGSSVAVYSGEDVLRLHRFIY